ncbi:MAG: NAD-dependent deacetylase [Rhizobiaceae bacterium]|nr:NAD-dependent deacetylase [Rhizobiaceae bacterium]
MKEKDDRTGEEVVNQFTDQLATQIDSASNIVVFTGAGISTESGIADFRSPGGIWSKIKPIQFSEFLKSEELRLEYWRRRFYFQKEFEAAPLNAGHHAVASIINSQKGLGLITQNIDGLHQRSGIMDQHIVEIHGNGVRAVCLECQSPMDLNQVEKIIDQTGASPRCIRCGGLVKSAVISFGQPMPQNKMAEAEQLVSGCDLCLVLGSSLVVQPAASLPVAAKTNGSKLVIINNQPTPLDGICDLLVQQPIGPTLQKALEKSSLGQESTNN